MTKRAVVSRFMYQADTVAPGKRKPVRRNLTDVCEYMVDVVDEADVVQDALVAVRQLTEETVPDQTRDEDQTFTLKGWDGRLWSPLRARDHHGDSHEQNLGTWTEQLLACGNHPDEDDAVVRANDSGAGKKPRLRDPSSVDEHDPRRHGRIVWDNRTAAMLRHQKAAGRLAEIGGVMHAQTHGPVWKVAETKDQAWRHGNIHLQDNTLDGEAFRIDRLDDAVALSRKRWGHDPQVFGTLLRLDQAYLSRDDLACSLHRHLQNFVTDRGATMLLALPVPALLACRKLQEAISIPAPFSDDGVEDPDTVVMLARTVLGALRSPEMPIGVAGTSDTTIGKLKQALDRANLEYALGRRPRLTASDDESLAQMAM